MIGLPAISDLPEQNVCNLSSQTLQIFERTQKTQEPAKKRPAFIIPTRDFMVAIYFFKVNPKLGHFKTALIE